VNRRPTSRLFRVLGLLDALATLVAIIAGLTGNLPAGVSQALNDLTTAASIILALLVIGGVVLLVPIIRSQLDPPFGTEQWFANHGRTADLNRSSPASSSGTTHARSP
jgi:hypothetical protein